MMVNITKLAMFQFVAVLLLLFRYGRADPVIRKPFGNITVSYCTIAKKTIAQDAYADATAGALTYKLLDGSKSILPKTFPFINFVPADGTVYVVPTSRKTSVRTFTENGQYVFYIRVQNQDTTKFKDDKFWLFFVGGEDVPDRNIGFQLENKILLPDYPNEVNLLYRYIEKLLGYFETPLSSRVVQIYEYTVLDNGNIDVYYQNCTIRSDPCDDGANFRIFWKLNGTEFNPASWTVFPNKMLPEFKVKRITTDLIGKCLEPNTPARFLAETYMAPIYVFKQYPFWIRLSPYPGMLTVDLPLIFEHEVPFIIGYVMDRVRGYAMRLAKPE